uniref:Uncharacterized protein n=1 Tax=Arundo donax TaxID=35708 RepID=A0A0A9HFD6_ARUDO
MVMSSVFGLSLVCYQSYGLPMNFLVILFQFLLKYQQTRVINCIAKTLGTRFWPIFDRIGQGII